MSEPFLWGSQFPLPSGVRFPHVTAFRNGTFLAMGIVGTSWPDIKMKAWTYNADGSLKTEQTIDLPDAGNTDATRGLLYGAIDPIAVDLPDGRIAITWTVSRPSSSGTYVAPWVGIYDADLKPIGVPKPVFDPISGARDYAESVVALNDGTLVISDRNELNGHAYLRVFSPDGTRSPALDLGTAGGTGLGTIVTDATALSNGNVAVVVRTDTSTLTGYVLTPSGSSGPSLSAPFSITTSASPVKGDVKVTALQGGGFVVTWTEQVSGGPSYNSFLEVFDAQGQAVSGVKPVPSITHPELLLASNSDVLALPTGGFAVAYEKSTKHIGGVEGFEVYLALFDKSGSRVTEDIRVSDVATTKSIDLEELLLLADGRILVRLSQGMQIVDPRDEAVSLNGTAGSDHYIGTAFNDTFEGSAGADKLDGGNGIDLVSFVNGKSGVTASLSGGSGGDAAGDTYISIEGLLGSSFDDVLTGNGSAILKGQGGGDTYYVRAGDVLEEAANEGRDTVIVGGSYALSADAQIEVLRLEGILSKTSVSLTGSNINNEIIGHAGTNTLKGLGGNDLVKASSGNDRVEGGSGSDTLYGGSGNDKLYGGTGTGKDVFVFDTALSRTKNVDRIYDFNPKYDSIQLENKIFTKLGKGSSTGVKFKSDMFVKSTQAQDREDRIVYDKATGALYYDQDGTGSKAQVKIATLNKNLKLTASDFFVI